MLELNKIYNMDCVEGMKLMDDESVDLTVTSPPYDNLREYNGYNFNFEETAKQLYRITKQGGVVVWIVNDATISGSETGTSFKQALYFKECGFNLHDTMIWHKPNGFNFGSNDCYRQSFEYMFILSKGKPKSINFIRDVVSLNSGKMMEGLVKNKKGESIKTHKNFYIDEYKKRDNVWEIRPIAQNHGHPAVFPLQLAKDHIISWSSEGDTVLDCFMGSGTTAAAAKSLCRDYIGFEVSEEYYKIAEERALNTPRGDIKKKLF